MTRDRERADAGAPGRVGDRVHHAALDEAEGTSHGWADQAAQLRAQLVPPGLDPDPLATVERLVTEEKASGGGASGG